MQLTFSPALGEAVPLVVRPGKHGASQDVLFKATFDSFASYEHARSYGVRVEMWTDLPMEGKAPGQWSAVPFVFQDFRDEEHGPEYQVLPLPSPADEDAASSHGRAVYANLPLRLVGYRSGHRFSFTYRLVYASGEIRWLGAFGQNGTLVVDQLSLPEALGVTLGEGWEVQDDGVVLFEGGPANRQEVGKLLAGRSWSTWAVGRDRFSPTHMAESSTALVLVPSLRGDAITTTPPVVISASSGTTIGIDARGRIIFSSDNDGARLALRIIDDTRFVALTDCDVHIRLLGSHLNPASARIVAFHAPGAQLPLSVLVLPPQDGRASQEVPLDISALAPAVPNGAPRSFVVTTSNKQVFLVPPEDEQTTVSVGALGGVALVAPLYDLATLESAPEYSWKVSVLQPRTNGTLTKFEEEVDAVPQRLLPTPPPSPPTAMRVVQRPPPLALPSFAEASEVLSSMQSSARSSAVSIPAAAPVSASPTSVTNVRPPTPYPITRTRDEADDLAIMRLHSIYPLRPYAQVLLAMFAWIWRVIFQRFAFLWLGAAGVHVSESGADYDESTTPVNSPEAVAHEDRQPDDDGESVGEDEVADEDIPEAMPTPTAVATLIPSPILQPEPKIPVASPKMVRSLPAIRYDVSHHDGQIALLVQAPDDNSSVSERMRFVMNGKPVTEPHIVAKRNGHHVVQLDAPIGCESKLLVTFI
ncbi:uncharacterized protein C8Q71DRAFT_858630 [Rhodofomes roseus]|uniref:Transmembrane protein n=1 Tax=Rhodofomes roseus TaxID=34475 RepID=A0ABQ8KE07_9APHY|nr:uncharacterized protein C8Q71DRAFT_858630 [Rhodofomes roseus]KAH9835786.1 hypothetical protein C8Q71DRAFT_858630 [Rhodofomes roseus]